MSDHYYSEQPQSAEITEKHTSTLNNIPFTFTTGTGVFSKKGIDFGTRVLIETFVVPEITGDILDLGCGYGPIGLAVAKANPNRQVMMLDINERAIKLAKENAAENKVGNVTIIASNGFEKIPEQKKFAAIITNPPIRTGKKVLYPLFEESLSHLKNEGEMWIVVQKKQGAPSMKTHLESLFQEVRIVTKQKGYFILAGKKV